MAANPYFPLYASDFMYQTLMMEDWQISVYMKIICTGWLHGKIKADANALAKINPMAQAFLNDIPESVKHQFRLEDNHWTFPKFDEHKAKQNEVRQKKTAAGKKGAEARWRKEKKLNPITSSSSSNSKRIADANAFNENESENDNVPENFEGGPGETLVTQEDIQWLITTYNSNCSSLNSVKKITNERNKAISQILLNFSKSEIEKTLLLAGQNEFLNGAGDKKWKATFDWIMRTENFLKIAEGGYYTSQEKESTRKGKNRGGWNK